MSRTKNTLMNAEFAVEDVGEEALRIVDDRLPNFKERFANTVERLLKEQEHIEANNPFISQVAIMYLINNFRIGDRDENIY